MNGTVVAIRPSLKFSVVPIVFALLAAIDASATNSPVQLRILMSGSPGNQTPELSWASQTGAIYRIEGRTTLTPGVAWETIEPVLAESSLTRWKAPELNAHSDTRFFRLVLPQPEIFGVEPAQFAFGGPAELYVTGQCFGEDTELRVGPLTLTNREVIHPGLIRARFTPPTPGTYAFDLVRTGAVLSSFLVTCYEASAPPASVLQEPPDEPLASPCKVVNKGTVNGNINLSPGYRVGGVVSVGTDWTFSGSAMKVKEKGNRTKCTSNLRVTPSGEVKVDEVDLFIPGRGLDFIWGRRYLSRSGPNTEQGNRWDFSYNVRVQQVAGGMEIRDGMGRADLFREASDGTFGRDEHFSVGTLTGGVFRLTFADTGYWEFHALDGSVASGRLERIVDRNLNTMHLGYDALGRLAQVIDTLDRIITISYSPASGKISSITDFAGRRVTYAYYRAGEAGGNDGDLKSVTSPPVTGTPTKNDFPTGKTTTYTYSSGFSDPRENSLLLSVRDPKGQISYDHVYQHNQTDLEFLRCIARRVGNPSDIITYKYLPQVPSPANRFAVMKIIINGRVGNVSECSFDARHRLLLQRALTGRAVPGLQVSESTNRPAGKLRADDPDYFETRLEWNNDSLCTRTVHPRGNMTEMVYQRAFNQNDSRGNNGRFHNADLRILRQRACCNGADTDGDGSNDLQQITERFEHDGRFGAGAPAVIWRDDGDRGFQSSARVITDRDSGWDPLESTCRHASLSIL